MRTCEEVCQELNAQLQSAREEFDTLRAEWWRLRHDVDDARDMLGRFLIDRADKHDLRRLHERLMQPPPKRGCIE